MGYSSIDFYTRILTFWILYTTFVNLYKSDIIGNVLS